MASIGPLLQQRRFDEARPLLRRAVVANAGNTHAQANAQVALALAAIELEPQNSFALRSLGSLLVIAGAFAAGVARFRQTLAVAPGDLITTYTLAQAPLELDPDEHRDEADRLLLQVIEAQPYGELANKAKELRGSIATCDLRADQPEGLRLDAVCYCLQALQLFEGMDHQHFIAVLSEVAAPGQGSWSGLARACLVHVGMKRLTPDQDSGLGIGGEE